MAITVSISRQDLMREGACREGLALFDNIKALADERRAALGLPARRGLVIRWTPLHALWAAVTYPEYLGWLAVKRLVPRADLAGTNLARADLAGAYLAGADLSGADLSGVDLSGANLDEADLTGAYLAGAYLAGADLYGADLSGAFLARADLAGAYLAGADLSAAYLAGADLSGADLSGARRRRTDPAIYGWEVVGAECGCCVYLRR